MAAKITPRVDIAFKKIFGVEENKDLLISLVNSIVGKEDQIVEVKLLNPYNSKNFATEKLSIVDIKAKGETGKKYNIEIQISNDADYDKRALYYWAKIYTEQLETGQTYKHLSKAIGIHILNFKSVFDSDKYHNVFRVKEDETGEPFFNDLELHTIELQKFDNNTDSDLDEILAKVKGSIDMWMAFLSRHELFDKNNLPKQFNKPVIKKALKVLEVMNFTAEERDLYEGHLKWLMVEASTLGNYEAIGEAKGFERGKAKGIEEGREEGEQIRAKKTACNMVRDGVNLEKISEYTGLSMTDLKNLQNSEGA